MTTNRIAFYKNGNATVSLYSDGTRVVECDGDLRLRSPLNLDIRVSSKCCIGCKFCHEQATKDGRECYYGYLKEKIEKSMLPAGMEFAIGVNDFTPGLEDFLRFCRDLGFICNITVNQYLLRKSGPTILRKFISDGIIFGLGISYRTPLRYVGIPSDIIEYQGTVIHVIVGIDEIQEVYKLAEHGIKKILVLGEKRFRV